MQSEFGVGMKNAEELRLNRGGWQVCLYTGYNVLCKSQKFVQASLYSGPLCFQYVFLNCCKCLILNCNVLLET